MPRARAPARSGLPPVKPVPISSSSSRPRTARKSVTKPLLKGDASASARQAASSSARLFRDADPPLDIDAAASEGRRDQQLRADRPASDLRLALRDNALRLEARNAGGVANAHLVVSYQRSPVEGPHRRPHRAAGGDGESLTPTLSASAAPVFAGFPSRPAPGRAAVGRGGRRADPQGGGRARARQRLPAPARRVTGCRRGVTPSRALEADLLLNQAGKNRVELGLPALESDAATLQGVATCNCAPRALGR